MADPQPALGATNVTTACQAPSMITPVKLSEDAKSLASCLSFEPEHDTAYIAERWGRSEADVRITAAELRAVGHARTRGPNSDLAIDAIMTVCLTDVGRLIAQGHEALAEKFASTQAGPTNRH